MGERGGEWAQWVALYRALFVQQDRAYALQLAPAASQERAAYRAVRRPVSDAVILAHLKGEQTAAWYQLDAHDRVGWGAYDCDATDPHQARAALVGLYELAVDAGLAVIVERSRRGGHLWVFGERPGVPAWQMLRLLSGMLHAARASGVVPADVPIEVYPKQVARGPDGLGSALRGPLGVHRQTGVRYPLMDAATWTPVGATLRAQLDVLERVDAMRTPATAIAAALQRYGRREARSETQATGPSAMTRSAAAGMSAADAAIAEVASGDEAVAGPEGGEPRRVSPATREIAALVNARCDLRAELAHWTELDAQGRGSCPLHPPDWHPSFAVVGTPPHAHWVCFHETNPQTGRYLGGDLVALVARLHGLSYGRAAWELARARGLLAPDTAAPWRGRNKGQRIGRRYEAPTRAWLFHDAEVASVQDQHL